MPLCARDGSGAGALVRWPLVDVGQGGRGVLPQAVNNKAVNAIDVFQYVCSANDIVGWPRRDLEGDWKDECMVMVGLAIGCAP